MRVRALSGELCSVHCPSILFADSNTVLVVSQAGVLPPNGPPRGITAPLVLERATQVIT